MLQLVNNGGSTFYKLGSKVRWEFYCLTLRTAHEKKKKKKKKKKPHSIGTRLKCQQIWKKLPNMRKKTFLVFPSWHSGSESNWESWGWGVNPWSRSVGWGSGVAVSCGIGHRHHSDPVLLWLWPAVTAPIGPLAWELPYATGADLKSKEKNKNEKAFPLNSISIVAWISMPFSDYLKVENSILYRNIGLRMYSFVL